MKKGEPGFSGTGGESARGGALPPALLSRWRGGLAAWGAPPRSFAALEQLSDPRVQVVVTGQQPGPWGGPLFSLYKAATAVAFAEKLAQETGHPAVPVFWVQGDDTDWGEVGWGAIPRPDLEIFRHRFEVPAPPRHWVGGVHVPVPGPAREIARSWGREETLGGFLPEGDSEELSSGFVRALLATFGSFGILPIDGRFPEIRAAGASLWASYLQRHREIAAAVTNAGARLREEGRDAPIDPDASDRGLFLLDGERRREIDPRTWNAEARTLLEAGESERLAPSVLLRAALQDHLLASAAHVVGATEAAYLRQLAPVYQALGVQEPLRVPRLSATLVPRGFLDADQGKQLLGDPESWLSARAGAMIPPGLRTEIEDLRGRLRDGLDRVASAQAGDVNEVVASASRKMDYEMKRIEDALLRRARQDLYRRDPRLRNAGEFLRPRRGHQERGLSGAAWALLSGPESAEDLVQAARTHLETSSTGEALPLLLEVGND